MLSRLNALPHYIVLGLGGLHWLQILNSDVGISVTYFKLNVSFQMILMNLIGQK